MPFSELELYYRRAAEICQLPATSFELPADELSRPEYFHHYDQDLIVKNFRF